MPMQWNAENDRLLLLILIKTHGISVNSDKIQKGWPDDAAVKPTARAITERFVKLRQLAGLKATTSASSTPTKPRPSKYIIKTPTSSAKKRKTKQNDSESDADDHLTEEETPTAKRQSTQRGGGGRGGRGKMGDNLNVPSVQIKSEFPDNELEENQFGSLITRASELRAVFDEPSNPESLPARGTGRVPPSSSVRVEMAGINDMGGMNGAPYYTFNGAGTGTGNDNVNMAGMNFNPGTYSGSIPDQEQLMTPTSRFHLSNEEAFSHAAGASPKTNNGYMAVSSQANRASTTPSQTSAGQSIRSRFPRKASQQASETSSSILKQEEELYDMAGEASSEEDSQGSMYHESDGEYL